MRWKDLRRSQNVEDRRGAGFDPSMGDLGGMGLPSGTGGGSRMVPLTGAGGCVFLIALVAIVLLGGNPGALLDGLGSGSTTIEQPSSSMSQPPEAGAPSDENGAMVAAILGSTEDVWGSIFQQSGARYRQPALVLYTDITPTGCGTGEATTGPFYCPGDEKVYLDLGFLGDLRRLGAPGDFALAYVIAHEVGHHVQHLEGTDVEVGNLQQQGGKAQANALSVLMELQADCYAGIWSHFADQDAHVLEAGDIQEGLQAAAAVGDDRLLRMSGRPVRRESFTHGSSEERVAWLKKGLDTGSVEACDTFQDAGLR